MKNQTQTPAASVSRHTPGPWIYSAKLSGSENHRGFGIRSTDGWALADVQPADEDGATGEANARLIAAAPDLLAALKAMIRMPLMTDTTYNHCRSIFCQAHKSIAKAEGRE